VKYCLRNSDKISNMRRSFEEQELSYEEREYVIEGSELEPACEVLKLHGIVYRRVNNKVLVRIPQLRSTIVSFILDKEFELNALIKSKFGETLTLDDVVKVAVSKR